MLILWTAPSFVCWLFLTQSHEYLEKQKEEDERRLLQMREAERIEMIKHKKKDEESKLTI